MTKLTLLVVAISLSMMLFAFGAKTVVDDIYYFPKATEAPVIDGVLDGVWFNVTAVDVAVLDPESSAPNDWLDLSCTARVMWDDSTIYMYANILDDEVIDDEAGADYERDGFELYFDGDNSKNFDKTDGNDFQWRWNFDGTAASGDGPPEADVAYVATDFGFVFEIAIPAAAMNVGAPEDGMEIGFDIQLNDRDTEANADGSRETMLRWWGDNNLAWNQPDLWGTAVLDSREVSSVMDINAVSAAPVIDGEKDAVYDALPRFSMNTYVVDATGFVDLEVMTGTGDLDFDFYTGWDSANFYIFIEATDDILDISHANVWERDSFEIQLDMDNSKAGSKDANDVTGAFQAGAEVDPAGTSWDAKSSYASVMTDKGWNLEIAVPISALPLGFAENQMIGIEFQYNDGDASGARENIGKYWHNQDNTWNTPSTWGTAKFVGTPIAGTEVTAGMVAGFTISSVDDQQPAGVATEYALEQNYPNPFNPQTTISYNIADQSEVTLSVFNSIGERVATLVNGEMQSQGNYKVTFDATGLSSGVYFYQLQYGHNVLTQKMVLMK